MLLAAAVEEKTLVVLELGRADPAGEQLAAVLLVVCPIWLPAERLVALTAGILLLPVLAGMVLMDKMFVCLFIEGL